MLDCLALGVLTEVVIGGFFHPHTRVHSLPTWKDTSLCSNLAICYYVLLLILFYLLRN